MRKLFTFIIVFILILNIGSKVVFASADIVLGKITNLTSNSVTFNATINPNGEGVYYDFAYQLYATKSDADSKLIIVQPVGHINAGMTTPQSVSGNATDLLPNTEYDYYIDAANATHRFIHGSFTTLASTATPPVPVVPTAIATFANNSDGSVTISLSAITNATQAIYEIDDPSGNILVRVQNSIDDGVTKDSWTSEPLPSGSFTANAYLSTETSDTYTPILSKNFTSTSNTASGNQNSNNNSNTNPPSSTTTPPSTQSSGTTSSGGGIVPKCNIGTVNADKTGLGTPCNFDQLILLINNVITFLLFTIATPLVALIVCYAGFLLLTAGGNSERVTQGKSIMKNVIIGYIIALAAWLIINTIVKGLGFTGNTFLK